MARVGPPPHSVPPSSSKIIRKNKNNNNIYIHTPTSNNFCFFFFLFIYLFIVLFLTPAKINLGPIVQWFLHLYFPFFFFFFSRFKILFYSQWIWIILQLRHPDVKGDTSRPDPRSMSMVGWGHFTKVFLFLFFFLFFLLWHGCWWW